MPAVKCSLCSRLGASINEFRKTIRQLPVVRQVQQKEVVGELKRYDFRHGLTKSEDRISARIKRSAGDATK